MPRSPTPDSPDEAWLVRWLASGEAPYGGDDPSVLARREREPADRGRAADLAPNDGDDWLDEEFPLGDGVADVDGVIVCPYCGEANEIALDPGSGAHQDYVEDCQVCCRPWRVRVTYENDGTAHVHAEPADDV